MVSDELPNLHDTLTLQLILAASLGTLSRNTLLIEYLHKKAFPSPMSSSTRILQENKICTWLEEIAWLGEEITRRGKRAGRSRGCTGGSDRGGYHARTPGKRASERGILRLWTIGLQMFLVVEIEKSQMYHPQARLWQDIDHNLDYNRSVHCRRHQPLLLNENPISY
jgi:hypothetical protein